MQLYGGFRAVIMYCFMWRKTHWPYEEKKILEEKAEHPGSEPSCRGEPSSEVYTGLNKCSERQGWEASAGDTEQNEENSLIPLFSFCIPLSDV